MECIDKAAAQSGNNPIEVASYLLREDLKTGTSLRVKVLLSWMGGRGLKFKKNSLFTLLNRMLGPTINLSFISIILQSKHDKI